MLEKINNFLSKQILYIIILFLLFCNVKKPRPFVGLNESNNGIQPREMMLKGTNTLAFNNVVFNDESSKMIKTASLTLETRDPDNVKEQIEKEVGNFNGFIQTFNSHNNSYTYIVKIKTEKLSDFLNQIKNFADVKSENISANSVKNQYNENETRLKILKERKAKLEELVKQTKDTKDILQIDNQISYLSEDINRLEQDNKDIDNDIDNTKITISITPKLQQFGEIWNLKSSLNSAINNAIIFGQKCVDFTLNVVVFSPLLIVVGIIIYKKKK